MPESTASAIPSATPDATPVAWTEHPIPTVSTNGGAGLAVGGTNEAPVVHVVVSNLEEALENGEDASAYSRSFDGGSSWHDETLVPGIFPAIASAGEDVYLAYTAYACRAGIGVQRNRADGAPDSWSKVDCLSEAPELVSWFAPSVAAVDDRVYVAGRENATDIATVWVSGNRGTDWARTRLRSLDAPVPDSLDFSPTPVKVAAAGDLVVVAWDEPDGVYARVSRDGGASFEDTQRVGGGGLQSLSVGGGRAAISGATSEPAPWMMILEGVGWSPAALPHAEPGTMVDFPATRVTISPEGDIGVLWARAGDTIEWSMSTDGGATWSAPEPVALYPDDGALRWSASGVMAVVPSGESYTLFVRP